MNKHSISFAIAAVVAVAVAGFAHTGKVNAASTGCVDGNNAANFSAKWVANNKATVTTKSGKAVCNDATVYLSSFVMPDTWDGNGFDQSAVPQTLGYSTHTVIKAGVQNPTASLTVTMPNVCKNVQTDVYLGPEQTYVTMTHRIAPRLILDNHFKGTGKCETPKPPVTPTCTLDHTLPANSKDCVACKYNSQILANNKDCKTPVTPVTPTTPVTPETPQTPATPAPTPAPEAPAALPNTGAGNVIGLFAGSTTVASLAYALIRRKLAL